MKVIAHDELVSVIKTAYKKNVTCFIWGATGIGKSETVRQAGREIADSLKLKFNEGTDVQENNFSIIDVRLSQFDPSDLRGLPFVTQDGKTKWAYPSWLPTKGKGLLLLDEVNLAPPLVQSSAYQLVLDKKLGDYTLPAGWSIVAAGNRAEDKAYTFELAAPLCNRFIHFELGLPSIDDWTEWASVNKVDRRIITFLNYKPSFLFKYDSKIKEKAFPTPRSWAKYCSPLIAETGEDYKTLLTLMSSAVGDGVAMEAVAYIKLSKQFKIADIIANPKQIESITGIDVKYSLVAALAEYCKKDLKKTLPEVCGVIEYLEKEFAILTLRFVKDEVGVDKIADVLKNNKVVLKAFSSYLPYLKTFE